MKMKTTKETYVKPELETLSLELETPLLRYSMEIQSPWDDGDPTSDDYGGGQP